ncbi:MAG: hypothetical protein GYB65_24300 [Chloroflexi bacterium]|nr:hypothetical protein [Chloroflexota bacterium]
MRRLRRLSTRLPEPVRRFSFLLAGIALAGLIIQGFLWYGAAQAPNAPFVPNIHQACGEPVALRAEDYNRWGGTRPGDDMEVARVDFCDPALLLRADGGYEVWVWMAVEVTGQVFPYAGWGFPWSDVETPFPADRREARNPWWSMRSGLTAIPNGPPYQAGDGFHCPHNEARQRGVDLFYFRDEGFQLPVGTTHSGWVCLYFDNYQTVPDAFTLSIQPDRARITQWVDKLLVVRDTGWYPPPALPAVGESDWCDYLARTQPGTLRAGEVCAPDVGE